MENNVDNTIDNFTDHDIDNELNNMNDDFAKVDDFDKRESYLQMIKAHQEGNNDEATKIFTDILSHKTSDMLQGWYHMAGDLKTHLTGQKTTE